MSKKFQTPSMSNPSFPTQNVAAPSETAINASAPEYHPTQNIEQTNSEPPPPYSPASKWTEGPNSFLQSGDSQLPAQLPITQQPGYQTSPPGAGTGGIWMPSKTRGCPPELEHLASVDILIVQQRLEFFELNSRYDILNSLGHQVYTVEEDFDCCNNGCYGRLRSLDIQDNNGVVVLNLFRDINCNSCCCPKQVLQVSSSQGLIGIVQNELSFGTLQLQVLDASSEPVLRINGIWNFSLDTTFEVLDLAGVCVGGITKQWSGFMATPKYVVSFPSNSEVNVKATLLGAVFLIDFLFKQMSSNNSRS